MQRLKPDISQFNEKNHHTIFEFFPRLDSDSLQLNLGICLRRSMLRLYRDTTQFNGNRNFQICVMRSIFFALAKFKKTGNKNSIFLAIFAG